jgi:UTP--glucose-1-phosphate uridylyltransferase
MLHAKGKDPQADMVRNIVPAGVECILVHQAEQLGLGDAVFCADCAVSGDPFAVLLADDFLTDCDPSVTKGLVNAFAKTGKSQLSVIEVEGPNTSKYGVVVPNGPGLRILGLVEKPDVNDAPSNLASMGRYVLTPDIFGTSSSLNAGSGGEIQLVDATNIHVQLSLVETVPFNGHRYGC